MKFILTGVGKGYVNKLLAFMVKKMMKLDKLKERKLKMQ